MAICRFRELHFAKGLRGAEEDAASRLLHVEGVVGRHIHVGVAHLASIGMMSL